MKRRADGMHALHDRPAGAFRRGRRGSSVPSISSPRLERLESRMLLAGSASQSLHRISPGLSPTAEVSHATPVPTVIGGQIVYPARGEASIAPSLLRRASALVNLGTLVPQETLATTQGVPANPLLYRVAFDRNAPAFQLQLDVLDGSPFQFEGLRVLNHAGRPLFTVYPDQDASMLALTIPTALAGRSGGVLYLEIVPASIPAGLKSGLNFRGSGPGSPTEMIPINSPGGTDSPTAPEMLLTVGSPIVPVFFGALPSSPVSFSSPGASAPASNSNMPESSSGSTTLAQVILGPGISPSLPALPSSGSTGPVPSIATGASLFRSAGQGAMSATGPLPLLSAAPYGGILEPGNRTLTVEARIDAEVDLALADLPRMKSVQDLTVGDIDLPVLDWPAATKAGSKVAVLRGPGGFRLLGTSLFAARRGPASSGEITSLRLQRPLPPPSGAVPATTSEEVPSASDRPGSRTTLVQRVSALTGVTVLLTTATLSGWPNVLRLEPRAITPRSILRRWLLRPKV